MPSKFLVSFVKFALEKSTKQHFDEKNVRVYFMLEELKTKINRGSFPQGGFGRAMWNDFVGSVTNTQTWILFRPDHPSWQAVSWEELVEEIRNKTLITHSEILNESLQEINKVLNADVN